MQNLETDEISNWHNLQHGLQYDLLLLILHHCQKLLFIQNKYHSFVPVINHDLQLLILYDSHTLLLMIQLSASHKALLIDLLVNNLICYLNCTPCSFIPYIKHKTICPSSICPLGLCYPPLDSKRVWAWDFWSNNIFLKLQNKYVVFICNSLVWIYFVKILIIAFDISNLIFPGVISIFTSMKLFFSSSFSSYFLCSPSLLLNKKKC